jgi:hypothetical protein
VDPVLAEEKQRNLRLYGLKVFPIEDNGLWRAAAKIKATHGMSLPTPLPSQRRKPTNQNLWLATTRNLTGSTFRC